MSFAEPPIMVFDRLLRAYPVIIVVIFCSLGIVLKDVRLILYGFWIVFEGYLNSKLKRVARRLWNNFPQLATIFGPAERPCDECDCSSFRFVSREDSVTGGPVAADRVKVDVTGWDRLSRGGMPSGHAQIAFSVATFWTLYHLNVGELPFKPYLLIPVAFLVSISRVFIKCHTIQQVIIGGLIGILTGIGSHKFGSNLWMSA